MASAIQWVLDTRNLWPEAAKTADLENVAARAMGLLLASERAAVLRYYHVRDAKMALASALLKRLVIARSCPTVPWPAATAVRDPKTTKPVFYGGGSRDDGPQPVLFNVSHQAGLVVVLAATACAADAQLGVDVVCPPERRARDLVAIRDDGWAAFVGVHDSVLSPTEARRLRELSPAPALRSPSPDSTTADGDDDDDRDADWKLAHFYALWCLREAYVKMTGDALLAPWLADLEMRDFAPPPPPPTTTTTTTTTDQQQQLSGRRRDVYFASRGGEARLVADVDLRIEWFSGQEYMISTAVRNPDAGAPLHIGPFEVLDLDTILEQAEKIKATR